MCMQEPSLLHRWKSSQVFQGALTKCHPPADNLWRLFHVIDGGDRQTPVGYRAPEVLQGTRQEQAAP